MQERLKRLRNGRLEVHEAGQTTILGGGSGSDSASEDLPAARLEVADSACWRAIALGGSVGAGESYMAGQWRSPDLAALLRLMLREREVLEGLEGPMARLTGLLRRGAHALRRNTRLGARKNIAAHYDVGNDFFELVLDPTMLYSCAYFESEETSLEEASIAKLDRLCAMLRLEPGMRVLEIGSGWGACAIYLARQYGCEVVSITISQRQFDEASRRVEAAGVADRVELRLQDYRDVSGRFDRLISIEMIEAVGAQYLDLYLQRCSELLVPDGRMALQAITVTDQVYRRAVKTVDFIKQYIFPGGFLPSIEAIMGAARRRTDFRLVQLEDIGSHYVRTLQHWADALARHYSQIRKLGYPDEFIRMYEFYFRYCEAGFAERTIGDAQMLLAKPQAA